LDVIALCGKPRTVAANSMKNTGRVPTESGYSGSRIGVFRNHRYRVAFSQENGAFRGISEAT
jgi:hypothetical protein